MDRNTRVQYFSNLATAHESIQDFSESLEVFKANIRSVVSYPALVLEEEPAVVAKDNGDGHFFEEEMILYIVVKPISDSYEHINQAWGNCKELVKDIFSYIIFQNELERKKGINGVLLRVGDKIRPYSKFASDKLVAYRIPVIHLEAISLVYDPAKWNP